jgi:hypothetical protein
VLAQIVLFDGFDPLDVIAPFEVLSAGSDMMDDALDVRLVGIASTGPVTSGTRGLQLHGWSTTATSSRPVASPPDWTSPCTSSNGNSGPASPMPSSSCSSTNDAAPSGAQPALNPSLSDPGRTRTPS